MTKDRDRTVEAEVTLEECLKARSEAAKEFAEKLKKAINCCYLVWDGDDCGFDCEEVNKCINAIAKEMTEGDNGLELR